VSTRNGACVCRALSSYGHGDHHNETVFYMHRDYYVPAPSTAAGKRMSAET
jgi:hypothetical protein